MRGVVSPHFGGDPVAGEENGERTEDRTEERDNERTGERKRESTGDDSRFVLEYDQLMSQSPLLSKVWDIFDDLFMFVL